MNPSDLASLNLPVRHLEPRQCHIAVRPTLISTVLGSCLAVTMYDPKTRIGGMSHAFLPRISSYPDQGDAHCKFVDSSIRMLLERFLDMEATKRRLEVKVFGGGEVLPVAMSGKRALSIGQENREAALATINDLGLVPMAVDVGGANGRKVLFLSHTGGVWVKKLHRSGARSGPGSSTDATTSDAAR